MLSLEHVPDGSADAIGGKGYLLSFVFVLNADDIALADRNVGLGVAVIFSIEGQVIQISLDVVPHDCYLGQSSVEGFGGGCVDNITQTKNISILFVLEGLPIHIEESRFISQSSIRKGCMGGGGHQGVKLVVGFFYKLS